MKRIRVMIVEDSPVISALLAYCVGRDPRLEVCAAPGSAEEALDTFEEIAPDVIAMDIRLPGIDGLEATRRIMSKKPVPIVVVASSIESGEWNSTPMEALQAGALAVLEKPVGTTHVDYAALAERLCTQLFIMSQVKLVRRRDSHTLAGAQGDFRRVSSGAHGPLQMLGIVCSTGGPGALVQLLGGLGPEFTPPILLVQHMTASFIAGFASWLSTVCPFPVKVVKDDCVPVGGTVYLAPAERHLYLSGGRLRLDGGDPVSFQRPSGTVLFQSMARDLGPGALGVLLTGMGDDGASGLLAVRRANGYTIAEDESTAVVYGMPAVAVRLGAVLESLPLPAIAPRVRDLVSCKNS
jgi:two-component system, chemotaxis family, protein-glutamate methylesterase/glutaminase